MDTKVTVYINTAADAGRRYFDGYVDGDPLTEVLVYDLTPGTSVDDELERVFRFGNDAARDDAEQALSASYYAKARRSFSVGDVVQVGAKRFSCAGSGWKQISGLIQ